MRGLSNDRVLLPIASGAATRRAVGSMLRGHRGLAVGAVVTIVAAAVAGLAFPPIVGRITDAVIAGSGVATIDVLAAALLGALLAQAVLSGWATVLVARLGEQALAALREDVVDRALSVPLAQVERAGTGDLVARVGDDVDAVSRAVREAIPALVVAVVTIALTVVGLAFLDWRLALAGFVAVPIHVLAVRWYQRRAGPQYAAERVAGGERAQQLTETVSGRTNGPGVPARPRSTPGWCAMPRPAPSTRPCAPRGPGRGSSSASTAPSWPALARCWSRASSESGPACSASAMPPPRRCTSTACSTRSARC